MRKHSWHMSQTRWAILLIALLVVGYVVLDVLPFGKPDDLVQQMFFSPQQATVHRTFIGPGRHGDVPLTSLRRSNRRDYQPRSVTLTSNGTLFRAYLLDLSGFEDSRKHVEAFMTATTEIDEGREPTTAPIAAKAVDVTEARFPLSRGISIPFLGDGPIDRMLIVASDGEAEVTLRVSYRR